MAKMIDKEPKYEGEKIVWHELKDRCRQKGIDSKRSFLERLINSTSHK